MRPEIHGQPPLSAAEFTASRTAGAGESRDTRTYSALTAVSALKSEAERQRGCILAAARPVKVCSLTAPVSTSSMRDFDRILWTVALSIVVREKNVVWFMVSSSFLEIVFLRVGNMSATD